MELKISKPGGEKRWWVCCCCSRRLKKTEGEKERRIKELQKSLWEHGREECCQLTFQVYIIEQETRGQGGTKGKWEASCSKRIIDWVERKEVTNNTFAHVRLSLRGSLNRLWLGDFSCSCGFLLGLRWNHACRVKLLKPHRDKHYYTLQVLKGLAHLRAAVFF